MSKKTSFKILLLLIIVVMWVIFFALIFANKNPELVNFKPSQNTLTTMVVASFAGLAYIFFG